MAASDSRQAVVDALGTVPGLVVSDTMPDTPTPGAAWPTWSESRYTSGKLAHPIAHTYDVIALLPAGYHADTVDAADGLIEQLMSALSKPGSVDVAQPVQVSFDPNTPTMPGITVRVTVTVC